MRKTTTAKREQGLEVVGLLMFTLWQNLGRIVGLLTMVYAALWKRSIYVSTAVHGLGSVSSTLPLLPVFLR